MKQFLIFGDYKILKYRVVAIQKFRTVFGETRLNVITDQHPGESGEVNVYSLEFKEEEADALEKELIRQMEETGEV